MIKKAIILLLFPASLSVAQSRISALPEWKPQTDIVDRHDWLINKVNATAEVYRSTDRKDIILSNGLVKRSFRLQPNLTCIGFINMTNGEELLRTVGPEAKLTIDGKEYNVGGLYGQKQKAYLRTEWIDSFKVDSAGFFYKSYQVSPLLPYLSWKLPASGWMGNKLRATGKRLTFKFEAGSTNLSGVIIYVHYELYDGIPLICKWISVENKGRRKIKLNKVVNEVLAVPEEESAVWGGVEQMKVPHGLYVESNYAFNNSMSARLSDQTTHWKRDTAYTAQVNYNFNTPCLLEVYPPIGPGVILARGGIFKSIRTNELLLDGYDRERNGLAQRRMYQTIAPWITRNPIFMHVISVDPQIVKKAVDQCAETGYEGIILSFFSGIDMEDVSPKNIKKIKALVDYAHSKGVLLGGYSLFSSRRINDEEDVIDPTTGKADVHAQFEKAPCLGSNWGLAYLEKLKVFIKRTGLDIFENDGPYPGDVCASVKHPGHKGLDDSQWAQIELQKGFYHWCLANGIYVNCPDWYFLDGTNKIALGYREANFKLPREQQVILNRQNIYDGTWEKTPSMSWGFVPLTEYHEGGPSATIEPLTEHADVYELLMMQYYGAGIQACYRGPRLYDTRYTKELVTRVVSWYKQYRSILNADIIHLRRPDGRDWDGILHVNPNGKEKGLVMLYNPLEAVITRKIRLPLYYTGLKNIANIRVRDGEAKGYLIGSDNFVNYEVSIPANGYTWLVIE